MVIPVVPLLISSILIVMQMVLTSASTLASGNDARL